MDTSKIQKNYIILGGILVIIIIIGMIIFYLNPFHILNYLQIPLIILYIIVFFCVIIFIQIYFNDPISTDKNSLYDLQTSFISFLKRYLLYIVIFLGIAFVGYFIFKYFKLFLEYLLTRSFILFFVFFILFLTLFTNNIKEYKSGNQIIDIVKDVIMYIPCLIRDIIDFAKKDYENTPSSVFIVFIILIIYCLLFFVFPIIKKEQYKKDGVLLIPKSVYLNKTQISITNEQLREKIYESMPFYDRWIQKKLFSIYSNISIPEYDISYNDISYNDISYNDISYNDISYNDINNISVRQKNYIVPPDTETKLIYENFTSLMNQDTIPVNTVYKTLTRAEMDMFSILKNNQDISGELIRLQNKPAKLKAYIKKTIHDEPYLLSFVQKIGIIYSATMAARDSVLLTIGDRLNMINEDKRVYRYSLSMWVFLHKLEKNNTDPQVIATYGSLPSLYYYTNDFSLTLEYTSKYNSNTVLYKSTNILYQRWNHIVITYNYGTVDLFINNNLVGTYDTISPYINSTDKLIIGSSKNEDIGGICNVKYYSTPLKASKIKSIYKQFQNKDPPI
jgi:hypothetical protein